ncbi:helix-turn-helix domain-containing protein [Tenacibaculum discolor]|uniref:AraC family transcriptional regulator n=1 Tax=Tenacibaculum discolor TaxID=361581 RepID=A0A2G1BUV1_9FLAO|nr:AraC family transcriptional regulator [Tenacibaculum discolor]MDP2541956.1 AraC family transcriptional regulator [Tenacibaculum discolor]PHN97629.1 AraC family transcriptional regulator [Tenacibaculum discolor]
MQQDRTRNNILFSCLGQEKKDFQPFVEDHAVSFVIDGSMIINDGKEATEYNEKKVGFISKNQLVKTQKIPKNNKPFLSISVMLPKELLFQYSKENNIKPKGVFIGKPNFIFPYDLYLKTFFDSMIPYFENPQALTDKLAQLKTLELIELLLRDDRMQNILFNFQEDFKLDLEAYMNKNYMHNIPLEQFAQLTGRSISTFKRDFQNIYKTTPNKWLIKKRLELAHYLISKKDQKPSEVYFDVGFVNLSHFSRSFKAEFGKSPSEI